MTNDIRKKAAKVSRQYMIDRARSKRTWTGRRCKA